MAVPVPAASPLFLREAEVRRGLDLLSLAHNRLMRAIDAPLAAEGLGRAHHRALYLVARRPDLTVGQLRRLLGVTKQSLGRVLNELGGRGLIETRAADEDRRRRLLRLTPTGETLEHALFEALRDRLGAAYGHAGQAAVTGFWQVLEGLLPVEDRAWLAALGG